ncbi:MAG: flagellar basal body protein [Alphaproteobacteria bacterium]|nr:flagellar basal body protein [Alphaproteobacteria bacterium]
MSIDAALLIARSGLLHTQRALSNAADNVANAETEGYTRKRIVAEAVSVSGQGMGVRSLGPMREVDTALTNEMNKRRSAKSAAELRDSVLSRINEAHGDPEKGESLGDLVSKLRTSFVELRLDPSQVVKQQVVVLNTAQSIVQRFNDVARVVGETRQAAHDGIVQRLAQINSTLREIAVLRDDVVERTSTGTPTADAEDKLDTAFARLSELLEVKPIRQANGGILLLGAGGITIPLQKTGDVFSVSGAVITPDNFYGGSGTIPAITINGNDVTRQLIGGKLGEAITLRDQTLPRYQAELDVAAAELADRFRAEGLRLFTDTNGTVPDPNLAYAGSAQIGLANRIQINSAVRADIRLLRDGTETLTGPPSFTPNPVGGPAGFVTLIDRILINTFGEKSASGASWGGFATSGLGPDGTLSSPFGSLRTIEDYTALVTASQTADSAAATSALETAKQFSEGLEARFNRESRVDVDSEMASLIQLQNAYAANARVMTTAQSMWTTLFESVR